MKLVRFFAILFLMLALSGCTAVKVVATPLTVTRDIVDAPLVTLTNFFERGAEMTKSSFGRPQATAGWGLGGPIAGFGFDLSWLFAKSLSGVFGGVDYLICRSLYPNFPAGKSPWLEKGESWGSLYFPNTKALWGGEPDEEYEEERSAGAPAAPG